MEEQLCTITESSPVHGYTQFDANLAPHISILNVKGLFKLVIATSDCQRASTAKLLYVSV